ncbi:MAG: glutamyl-tRNA reductase [Bacteroidetes bacterium]|jgi:glutamyl-tRNA reductase|nr:glutamyl-tRNA reductase [Bacteroidota bacterium]
MLRGYKVITVTHKSIDVGDLGAYVVPAQNGNVHPVLRQAKNHFDVQELMYVQTCNRIMFVLFDKNIFRLPKAKDLFAYFHPEKDQSFYRQLNASYNEFSDLEAVEHVFSVAASVDSLVVGEREILRQLRTAYEECHEAGLTGDSIRLLMRYAIESAKKVYNHTRIGEKSISVASLASSMLFEKGLTPADPVLLVGAGETNTIIAKVLKKKGYHDVTVFNRSLPKAQFLAQLVGGHAYPLDQLAAHARPWKALIVCTAAQQAIITEEVFSTLVAQNDAYHHKLVLDLGIPKNVAPEVIERNDLAYIEIEGVRSKAEEHLAFRKQEVTEAVKIIHSYGREFMKAFQQRQIEKSLSTLPDAINEVKQRAINEVFSKDISELDDDSRALLLEMMDYMERKCVGVPMKMAKTSI